MTCAVCKGTGETGTFGIYDCAAPGCTAAQERHEFDMAFAKIEAEGGRMHPHDARWLVYVWGKAKGLEDAAKMIQKQGDSNG